LTAFAVAEAISVKSWAAELSDRLLNVIRLIKKLAGGYKPKKH
jgi:hypothetical protein